MKIINLKQSRKQQKLEQKQEQGKPLEKLEAELDIRTNKLLEELDSAHSRIDILERQVKLLVKIIIQAEGS